MATANPTFGAADEPVQDDLSQTIEALKLLAYMKSSLTLSPATSEGPVVLSHARGLVGTSTCSSNDDSTFDRWFNIARDVLRALGKSEYAQLRARTSPSFALVTAV